MDIVEVVQSKILEALTDDRQQETLLIAIQDVVDEWLSQFDVCTPNVNNGCSPDCYHVRADVQGSISIMKNRLGVFFSRMKMNFEQDVIS